MIKIYLFRRDDAPLPADAAALLPDWRRRRYDALQNEAARRESLAAGLLYAHAMADCGLSPDEPVTFLAAGKPVLCGREDVFFSLSHTGAYAMCAVADVPVGVDAQMPRPVKETLFRRFHPAEQAWLMALPESRRQTEFFRLWTRKEAWVKASSRERMLGLAEVDVIHGPAGLHFRDYVLPGGCVAAVCAETADIPEAAFVTPAALSITS